jgi:hypothetical protein
MKNIGRLCAYVGSPGAEDMASLHDSEIDFDGVSAALAWRRVRILALAHRLGEADAEGAQKESYFHVVRRARGGPRKGRSSEIDLSKRV